MDKQAEAEPVAQELTKKEIERACEYAMLDVMIASSDLQMNVFKNMREDLDKREVDQSIVDFFEKKLYAACMEFASAYEAEYGTPKEEVVASND